VLRNDETIISSISVTDIVFDVYFGKWNYRAIPKVKTWSYFLTIPKYRHNFPHVLGGVRSEQCPKSRKTERCEYHGNHKSRCMYNRRTEHDDTDSKRETRDAETVEKSAQALTRYQ